MYECGNPDPLGSVNVSFVSGGRTLLTTTTDRYGYFHLKGYYEIKVGVAEAYEPFLKIEYNGQNGSGFGSVNLMRDPPDVFNDTLYLYNSTFSVLRVEVDTSPFGDINDTLKVEYIKFNDNAFIIEKYNGPFTKGQILDTILTPTDSHVGYAYILRFPNACGYFINNVNYKGAPYPWVTGQPNNACGQYTDVYLKLD